MCAAGGRTDDGLTATARPPLRFALPVVAVVAGLGWLYWNALARLPQLWNVDPDLSHGYLVPVLALVFAWQQWRIAGLPLRTTLEPAEFRAGLARVATGLLVHAVCLFSPHLLFFDVLSLLLAISGLLIVLGGRGACRGYRFPLWFLVFMVPLPPLMYRWLSLALQQATSVTAAAALDVFGIPAVREGARIFLPGYALEVGAACSGLRGILGVLAAALAIGHWTRGTRAFRAWLAAFAVPAAVVANSLRVFATGLIVYAADPSWTQGLWHDAEGLVTTGLALAMLLGAAALWHRWIGRRRAAAAVVDPQPLLGHVT